MLGSEAAGDNVKYEGFNDEEVVASAKDGDAKALEYLINKYKGLIYSKAQSYFVVGSEKEDIVQEGMIGLYKAIKNFKGDRSVSFKMFADLCVTRQIITAIKTATRQKHIPLNSYISLNRPLYGDEMDRYLIDVIYEKKVQDPEEIVIDEENIKHLKARIKQILSPFELKVLCSYIEGKSYEEIALYLGKRAKSIDNAMQRIKKKLGRCI